MLNTEAEGKLGKLAEEGDLNARDQLLLYHQKALLQHIAAKIPKKLSGKYCPEDFLQETMRKALAAFDGFKYSGSGSVLAWLRMIATRTIIDANRKADGVNVTGNPGAHAGGNDASSYANLLEALPGESRGASKAAIVEEMREAFHLSLAKLSDSHRRVIELRYLRDRSMAEIAAELDRSEESVRGLLFRARKALREGMENLSLFS